MRKFCYSVAIAALTTFAFTAPASAAIFTTTWEGTLDSGTATTNSDPGVDISGRAFTVVYTVDDSLGVDGSTPPDVASVFGGAAFSVPTSPVTAVLTIEGLGSFAFSGNDVSTASRVNYAPVSTFPDAASFRSDDQIDEVLGDTNHHRTSSVFSFLTETDPAIYGTLFDSIAYDALPIRDRAASDQSIFAFQWNDIVTDLSTFETQQLFVEARASTGWIVAAAVPEPASWVLMIGGFAAVGFAMRRRMITISLT